MKVNQPLNVKPSTTYNWEYVKRNEGIYQVIGSNVVYIVTLNQNEVIYFNSLADTLEFADDYAWRSHDFRKFEDKLIRFCIE